MTSYELIITPKPSGGYDADLYLDGSLVGAGSADTAAAAAAEAVANGMSDDDRND